ncbi:MAG: pentapeptide repeat-containing protein [Spirulinaceae cyanobacterium]
MSRDALVVGINTYNHLKDLKAPAIDAEAIAQRLQQDGDFQVRRLPEAIAQDHDQKRSTVAKTLPLSRQQLKAALKQLFQPESIQAPDTALFYFSGHGLPDETGYDHGYLATSDTDPSQPESGLSLRWLHWLLSESPVRQQIVWLDCCHSGALLVNVEAANPGHAEQKNRCFIASSRDFESSWQDLNSPYSVLTKALLDGLQAQANHWVNSADLVAYIKRATTGELQKPVCRNFGEEINLIQPRQAAAARPTPGIEADQGCPYKGLEYFDFGNDDPKYFFGREDLTGQLLDKVRTSNFLALVGASGNGKSSVLRAGLLHQLQLGRRIMESDQWRIRITRPDQDPMQNLALAFVDAIAGLDRAEQLGKAEGLLKEGATGLRRLVQADPAPRVILVIDQFEEVFTRCTDAPAREQFFATLMGALQESSPKLCLILAMRADFVGKCLEQDYSGLATAIQAQMVPVLPLNEAELRAAICQPAAQVGLAVEPALVTDILNDIAGALGSLPLLQYTLKELWQQRQGNQLTLASYKQLGGILGTLNERATKLYEGFSAAEQKTVQHIFQQLTQLGEGTEDTRRRVFLSNLVAEPLYPAERVQGVVNVLAAKENRLLVTSEVVSKWDAGERLAIVDVAHEALIRHWRLLRGWIETNRDLLRQQRRIEASAVRWQEQGKAKRYLLQGFLLKEALRFQKQQGASFPLSEVAKGFVRRSVWQQRWDRLKVASLLLFLIPVADYSLHIAKIEQHYANFDGTDLEEKRVSALFLVQDCAYGGKRSWYFVERFSRKYCRSLVGSNLQNANFQRADLQDANLQNSNLQNSNLRLARLGGANFQGANLREADLQEADLGGANLQGANLQKADLRGAQLQRAKFKGANLQGASFQGANLKFAHLGGHLRDADFREADLQEADLRGADLQGADLQGANLQGANFQGVNLWTANLEGVNFQGANFQGVNLWEADLKEANLERINFQGASLKEANLRGVNLQEANLKEAELKEANLKEANLKEADLRGAILLATDLRQSQNLEPSQFMIENSPLLCNVALPENLQEAGIDPDRDCEEMPQVMISRYYWWSPETAQKRVEEARQLKFNNLPFPE